MLPPKFVAEQSHRARQAAAHGAFGDPQGGCEFAVVDLMVFRMTGELPLEASPIDGFPHTNAYLIRTASQWVFGVRNL